MDLLKSKLYCEDIDIAIAHSVGLNKLNGHSILITGATGTIGSFIADLLIKYNESQKAGLKIYLAARNKSVLQNKYAFKENNELKFLSYDMLQPVDFKVPIDFVIHAAGNAHPAAFNGDPSGTIIGNIVGTYNLLEYLKKNKGKRFLYVSSGEVYGDTSELTEELEEKQSGYLDLLSSRSCYPISKRAAETLCASYYKQFGIETVIVRPSHTYGPCITKTDNRAHAQFIQNALKHEDIVLKSAGKQMRSYTYIADCASGILTVLAKGDAGEAYNIANENSRVTIAELAQIIAEIEKCKVVFSIPDKADVVNQTPIQRQVLNAKKLEKLGWKGDYDIYRGLRHTLSILKEK